MDYETPSFRPKRPLSTEMTLQITSMADIFTIILVFLLKSFLSGGIGIQPSAGTELPSAGASDTQVNALTVEISASGVQVDNKPVVELRSYRFPPEALEKSGLSRALLLELERQRERQKLISASNPDVALDDKILVLADRKTPYVTLKSVISAAALHGYTDLKLVVVKPE